MIFPNSSNNSSSSSSSTTPLPATLLDLYLDENNNSNLSNSSHSSIVAALMAVAATAPVAITDNTSTTTTINSSDDGMAGSSPIARLPLTTMALKHALYGSKPACISNHHHCHNSSLHHHSHHHHLHPLSNNSSCSSSPSHSISSSSPPSPTLPVSMESHDPSSSRTTTTATTIPSSPLKRHRPSSPGRLHSVKRALFADKSEIDHDANLALVKEQLRLQQQISAKRWNFDFESGRPLSSSPSSEQDHRFEWSPLMSTASTTCPVSPMIKPDTSVKRKLSISDYFTTTKKMKLVCKRLDAKSSTSSADEASTSDKSPCSSPIASSSSTSACGRDLDVQVIRCVSPSAKLSSLGSDSKLKSFPTSSNSCSKQRQALRSNSNRRSKRLARTPAQCKKQLKL